MYAYTQEEPQTGFFRLLSSNGLLTKPSSVSVFQIMNLSDHLWVHHSTPCPGRTARVVSKAFLSINTIESQQFSVIPSHFQLTPAAWLGYPQIHAWSLQLCILLA